MFSTHLIKISVKFWITSPSNGKNRQSLKPPPSSLAITNHPPPSNATHFGKQTWCPHAFLNKSKSTSTIATTTTSSRRKNKSNNNNNNNNKSNKSNNNNNNKNNNNVSRSDNYLVHLSNNLQCHGSQHSLPVEIHVETLGQKPPPTGQLSWFVIHPFPSIQSS